MEGTIYMGGGSPCALTPKTTPGALALKTVSWPHDILYRLGLILTQEVAGSPMTNIITIL
jgi:hypothetical protein